jgi:phospholipid-binding lipoprotein MlaA
VSSWPGSPRRTGCAAALLAIALVIAAPAHSQGSEDDPLEPVNRAIFAVNTTLDGLIVEPAAILYRMATPEVVRKGVRNFLGNLRTPVVLANDLMQVEWARAEVTFGRFMLNTILGLGGIIDVATWAGMPPRHHEDFGQTLAVYGVPPGPYLMLPLLGPSNPRDALGVLVDLVIDPLSFPGLDVVPPEVTWGRWGADVVSFREENIENIDELRRTSIDFYAATRTVTRQLRAAEIRNGAPAPIEDIYDEDLYDLDDLEDPASDVLEDPAVDE